MDSASPPRLLLAQPAGSLLQWLGQALEQQGWPGQATQERLHNIVSMTIAWLQRLELPASKQELAFVILARLLENISDGQLDNSTQALKEQGEARLLLSGRRLQELVSQAQLQQSRGETYRKIKALSRVAPMWGVRPQPASTVPASVSAALSRAVAAAARQPQAGEAAGSPKQERLGTLGKVLALQASVVTTDPRPASSSPSPPEQPAAGDASCRVQAVLQVLPNASAAGEAVRLSLLIAPPASRAECGQPGQAAAGPSQQGCTPLPAARPSHPVQQQQQEQQRQQGTLAAPTAAGSQGLMQLGDLLKLKMHKCRALMLPARLRMLRLVRARPPKLRHLSTSSGAAGGTCSALNVAEQPAAELAGAYLTGVLQPQWQRQQEGRRQINRAVLEAHAAAKKAWREAKIKAQRERMAALKANDLEAYMRQVEGAKNSKINQLLAQTDQCLRLLTERLKVPMGPKSPREKQGEQEGSQGSKGSPAEAGTSQVAALQQSNEAWNKLARAFEADVPQQPEMLKGGELREYQMKGLRWLVGLHDHDLNGILADEMGLGKTIQVISLICHLVEARGEARPFLIAVPASVLPNWEQELAAWAPGLRVVAYKGSANARQDIFYKQMRGGKSGAFDVALTTYECLMGKLDRPRLARVSWSYIIVDEGHRLKNAGCKLNTELKQYRAAHRLLLTGTPLQNRLEELWSLLNFLMPSLFNSSDDFQTWFGGSMSGRQDPQGGGNGDEQDDAAADAAMLSQEEALIVTNRLHQVLRPFMLRRLKETVASELPQKVERLVPCQPSAYQRALFGLIHSELQAAEGKGEGRAGIKGVNNTVMEMRNICNHPFISRLHPEGAETQLPPHCLPAEVRLCGKLELLDRMLVKLRAGGHRVLLFCTMTRLLDVLESYLDWRGFHYLRMDGGTSAAERGALVNEFNAPGSKAFVFLLSIRAGGVGLNLQSADTVIMYDSDWNPQMDLQAQARAHRLGQTKEVLVLRLQTTGTVEERIIAVASDKRSMADRSITGGFFDGKTSAAERQRYLLDIITLSAQQQQQGGGGGGSAAGAGQLSDDELNQLLARGDSELAVFAAEDEKLRKTELASWKALAGAQGGAAYSRLAPAEDIQPLADQALALATIVDEDEGKEFGRGKRGRGGGVSYKDMGEREFKRLCRDGVEGAVGAVKLVEAGGQKPAGAVAAAAPAGRATRSGAVPARPAAAAAGSGDSARVEASPMDCERQEQQQQQQQQQEQHGSVPKSSPAVEAPSRPVALKPSHDPVAEEAAAAPASRVARTGAVPARPAAVAAASGATVSKQAALDQEQQQQQAGTAAKASSMLQAPGKPAGLQPGRGAGAGSSPAARLSLLTQPKGGSAGAQQQQQGREKGAADHVLPSSPRFAKPPPPPAAPATAAPSKAASVAAPAAAAPSKAAPAAHQHSTAASAAPKAQPQAAASPAPAAAKPVSIKIEGRAGSKSTAQPHSGAEGQGAGAGAEDRGQVLLTLLECSDAEEARGKLKRMERKKLQELYEAVNGSPPNARVDTEKLRRKLGQMLPAVAPAAASVPLSKHSGGESPRAVMKRKPTGELPAPSAAAATAAAPFPMEGTESKRLRRDGMDITVEAGQHMPAAAAAAAAAPSPMAPPANWQPIGTAAAAQAAAAPQAAGAGAEGRAGSSQAARSPGSSQGSEAVGDKGSVQVLLGLLGCSSAEQAHLKLKGLERGQVQEVYGAVKGSAANPKNGTEKLRKQLFTVLATSSASPPASKQGGSASGVSALKRKPTAEAAGQQASTSPAAPASGAIWGATGAPPPIPGSSSMGKQCGSEMELFGESDEEEEQGAAGLQRTLPSEAAAGAAAAARAPAAVVKAEPAGRSSPPAGSKAAAAAVVHPAKRAKLAAPSVPTAAPSGQQQQQQQAGAGPSSRAAGQEVVVAKRITASDLLQGTVSLSTPSVEAALGSLGGQALEVTAAGCEHTPSLKCYTYGSTKQYKLLATVYLRAVGAKQGDALAIFKDAQGKLTVQHNTPQALQAVAARPVYKVGRRPGAAAAAAAAVAGMSAGAAGVSPTSSASPATAAATLASAAGGAAASPAAAASGGAGSCVGDEEELLVGKEVEVYWPQDDAWYQGRITGWTGRKHRVEYEDGDVELLCLAREQVRVL